MIFAPKVFQRDGNTHTRTPSSLGDANSKGWRRPSGEVLIKEVRVDKCGSICTSREVWQVHSRAEEHGERSREM